VKQTITFDRVQSVTVEFDLEQPISAAHAAQWANFGFGGADALEQMVSKEWKGRPPVRTSTTQWKATEAAPDFAVDVAPPKRKRRQA
jgi:hypothetical protein